MSADGAAVVPSQRRWLFWTFLVVMLALAAGFAGLGWWQLNRLAWKEGLIADIATRMHLQPVPLPPVNEWVGFDPQTFQYRPVMVTGHYVADQTVRVFTGLEDAKGTYSGPGYWVMTPFAIDGGGTVFIDRGFVPQSLGIAFADAKEVPAGTLTLNGVAMASEDGGAFTPGPDTANRIEWVRNLDRLSKLVDPGLAPIAPIYIDLPAGPRGALPQGGETEVDLPNPHLGYAATWFGFALTTIIMLAEWVRRQRGREEKAP